MTKSYIVQHTHWDREWYFTTEDAKVLSDQVFTEVLDELESNPNVNFCLDGQSSIVDEYIELNPDKLPVIQKLVEEKRLFIGPWFTQTDALLVDAESILRNLIIGINDTMKKYGDPMMVGYLPDTFGFNAQTPTLLNQVGIDNFMCWRGINFEKLVESPYFVWKGLGDRFVYAMNFPFGYMTGMMTVEAQENIEEFVKEKLDPSITFLKEHGENQDILIPSGIDQKNIVRDFDKVVEALNEISGYENVISDYPTYVDTIRKKKNLPKYQGELREPVYSRAHRSIGSVRTQMKLDNFKLEQKILRRIEPLMVIAKKNNIEISNGLLQRLWKKVLENQAHDSIGGCVSDNVAEDIFHRIKEANEIADGLENLIAKKIADRLELKPNQVLIFNTDPKPFTGEKVVHIVTRSKNIAFQESEQAVIVKEVYYPERKNIMKLVATGFDYFDEPSYYELDVCINVELPALGYKVIEFFESNQGLEEKQEVNTTRIQNDVYKLVYENNELTLETTTGLVFKDFVKLVDAANDGDTYDYSPLAGDKEIELYYKEAKVFEDSTKQSLVLYGVMEIPYDLEDRLSSNPQTGELSFELELIIKKGNDDLIEGKISVNNQVLSHRLRLQIDVGNEDETSIAQIQNGFVRNQPDFIPEDWHTKYVEKPVNLEIFDKSVTVENEGYHITVYADGLREYERVENKLFITLMATTGQLGKPNLAWRPGRASGDTTNEGHVMMPTPLAQELGINEFTFAVRVVAQPFDEMETAKISSQRLNSSISYQKQLLNVFINRLDNKIWPQRKVEPLSPVFSLLEVPDHLIVSAIYPSYRNAKAYVVRLANPTSNEVIVDNSLIANAKIVNALEEEINRESLIKPYDYMTLQIEYSTK